MGGGRGVWEFEGENGSLGLIGANLDGPLVVGNDTGHNRQAQAGAAFFGSKMREKQLVPVRWIDAHAVI